MLKVRFKTNAEDPRPINFPPPHPFWITGESDDYFIIVAYADSEEQISEYWPEAFEIDSFRQVESYEFSERFSRPDWLSQE